MGGAGGDRARGEEQCRLDGQDVSAAQIQPAGWGRGAHRAPAGKPALRLQWPVVDGSPNPHLSPTASAYWSVSMTDLRRHSRTLYDGLARAPARSYLLNIGFTHEDLQKPIVGVNHAWIGTMPCNFNHRQLAAWACDGVREAGGTPMEVNTISISDGVTMGTEGMKASLVSRELIADSVELVGRGQYFDAQLCITGCDKTVPAMAM